MLQIYGQNNPHSDVLIIGTHSSLLMLQKAISKALNNAHSCTRLEPSDGEQYFAYVFNTSPEVISGLSSHYSDSDFALIPGRKSPYTTFYQEIRSYLPIVESTR